MQYHVTSRGDRREDIYLDDEHRLMWLEVLGTKHCGNHEGDWKEVSRLQKFPLAKSLDWYKSNFPHRDEAMACAHQSGPCLLHEAYR